MSEYELKGGSQENGFLEYENSKVHFIKFGQGDKLLIALPGFGDPASLYLALQMALEKDYTVFAIDLPFHGKTQWNKPVFYKKDLINIFNLLAKKEGKQRFELMGYSFGGRIILSSLPELINSLDKIYLVASDGMQTDGMTIALKVPLWLRRVLEKVASKPTRFDWLLNIFYKVGFISKFNRKFIRYNLAIQERRDRIFKTWFSLNDFQVPLKKVKLLLKEAAIPVALYFGTEDNIITLKGGLKFKEGLTNVELNTLEEGHRLLNEKLNALLSNQLNKI